MSDIVELLVTGARPSWATKALEERWLRELRRRAQQAVAKVVTRNGSVNSLAFRDEMKSEVFDLVQTWERDARREGAMLVSPPVVS